MDAMRQQRHSSLPIRLVDPQCRSYSARISNEQWEEYKECLSFLHHQGFTRAHMLDHLRQEYDFKPSKQQLSTKMLEWGLRVYQKTDTYDDPDMETIADRDLSTSLDSPGFAIIPHIPRPEHLADPVSLECTTSAPNFFPPYHQVQHNTTSSHTQTFPAPSATTMTEVSTFNPGQCDPSQSFAETSTYVQEQDWFSRLLASLSTRSDVSRSHRHTIIRDLNDFADVLQSWPAVLDQCWSMSEHLWVAYCVSDTADVTARWLHSDSHRMLPVLGHFLRWSRTCLRGLAAENVSMESPLLRIDVSSIMQRLTCQIVAEWLALSIHEAESLFSEAFPAQSQHQKLKVVIHAAAISSLLAMAVVIELSNMFLGPDYFTVMSATQSDWIAALDNAFAVLVGLDEGYLRQAYYPLIDCALSSYEGSRLARSHPSPAPSVCQAFARLAESLVHDAVTQTVVDGADIDVKPYAAGEEDTFIDSFSLHSSAHLDFPSFQPHQYLSHHHSNHPYHSHHRQSHHPYQSQIRHSFPPSLEAHTSSLSIAYPLTPASVLTPSSTLTPCYSTASTSSLMLTSGWTDGSFDINAFKGLMLRLRDPR